MKLDKLAGYQLAGYYTEEEKTRLAEQQKYWNENIAGKKFRERTVEELTAIGEEADEIKQAVFERYKDARTTQQIVKDAKEIIDATEQADFLAVLKERRQQIESLKASGATAEALAPLEEYAKENFANCFSLLLYRVYWQATALEEKSRTQYNRVQDYARKRAGLWYVEENPINIPILHAKATDAFSTMSSQNASIDPITGNATIEKGGAKLIISGYTDIKGKLGISTDKLLTNAVAELTRRGNISKAGEARQVSFNLKNYARKIGYEVDEETKRTPEEQAKEKKRVKNNLDNARKAIKADLEILQGAKITIEKPTGGKVKDFESLNFVTRTAISSGDIEVSFSPELADYLTRQNLITQYPAGLWKIDGRATNAYKIGRKLALHANIDANIERNTQNIISVSSLLGVTDLPTIEDLRRTNNRNWQRLIKEPFLTALDELKRAGVLYDAELTHGKGRKLTDEEAYNLTDYNKFIELYLTFELANEKDHGERLARKKERKKPAKKKRGRK